MRETRVDFMPACEGPADGRHCLTRRILHGAYNVLKLWVGALDSSHLGHGPQELNLLPSERTLFLTSSWCCQTLFEVAFLNAGWRSICTKDCCHVCCKAPWHQQWAGGGQRFSRQSQGKSFQHNIGCTCLATCILTVNIQVIFQWDLSNAMTSTYMLEMCRIS